jgi:hypothetical protein
VQDPTVHLTVLRYELRAPYSQITSSIDRTITASRAAIISSRETLARADEFYAVMRD